MALKTRKFLFSRDVFHEEIFPFCSVVAAKTLVDPFPGLVLPKPVDATSFQPAEPPSVSSQPAKFIPSPMRFLPLMLYQQLLLPLRKLSLRKLSHFKDPLGLPNLHPI